MLKTQQKVPFSVTTEIMAKLELLSTIDYAESKAQSEDQRAATSASFAKTARQLARITSHLTVTLSTRAGPILRELRGYISDTAHTPARKIALASNREYWQVKAAQLLLPRVDAAMRMASA